MTYESTDREPVRYYLGRAIAFADKTAAPPPRHVYEILPLIRCRQQTTYDISTAGHDGQLLYLITWFVNTQGKTGPESEPLVSECIALTLH